jgi:hypothetical protein
MEVSPNMHAYRPSRTEPAEPSEGSKPYQTARLSRTQLVALRNKMLADIRLNRSELALGVVLLNLSDNKGGHTFASIDKLAAMIGVKTRRSIQQAAKKIVGFGYFSEVKGGGRWQRNKYIPLALPGSEKEKGDELLDDFRDRYRDNGGSAGAANQRRGRKRDGAFAMDIFETSMKHGEKKRVKL